MSFVPTPNSYSGLPLLSLPAVVLDTETTGLDTATDRVIEIGAVRLGGGAIEVDETFASFVDPGMAIPKASTAIHGIADADVAGAPSFPKAVAAFTAWAGASVVIGHSIGFDLAVLRAEHERHGLPWRRPRGLDVRHLVQLLAPNLPDQSLETAAGWLGIEIAGRHRALSDALLAGRIFLALVPRLQERGIQTLAQAERACRSLTVRLDEEARIGWQGMEHPEDRAGRSLAEYARLDSFPYRHRVGDLMSAPPLLVPAEASLKEALRVMVGRNVNSLFLAPEAGGGPYGIVTESDILRAIDAHGADALSHPVARHGQRPLITADAGEYVYRALAAMASRNFRHLGVVDGAGALVGALSMRDLLRQRAEDAVSLGDLIEKAEAPAELGRIWSALTSVARALVVEDVDARDIAAIISHELRALTRRACEMAEREAIAAGRGGPPCPYAVMVLGSGGRGESLLAMDQDNALVYRGGADADPWFAAFGERVSQILADAGVAYCKGGVMLSKPAWRMDLDGWRKTVGTWISRSRPEDVLNSDIFFDAVRVHGDSDLAETLLGEACEAAKGSRTFIKALAINAGNFDSPVGLFGRLRLDKGRLDAKQGGIMPIFSVARVVALEQGTCRGRATALRLAEAKALGRTADRTVDNLIEAHRILMNLILRQQLRDIDRGEPLSARIAPAEMTGFEKQELKWALDQVPNVTALLDMPVVG